MNNQLQITWAQPCEEVDPRSGSSLIRALQESIRKITCRVNRIDQFAHSLNSTFTSRSDLAGKSISRNILR